jgi:nucleotide-binding universal stress UspA family protein
VIVARPGSGGDGSPFAGQVVVGVSAGAAGHAAVEFAFEYADRHRLGVAAVHVAAAPRADADLQRTAEIDAWIEVMRAEVDPWAQKYPQIQVRSTVLHGPVSDSVTWAGLGANLLVVGNRRRGAFGRARTGDVPLSVARQAGCPVAVVPADRREGVLL